MPVQNQNIAKRNGVFSPQNSLVIHQAINPREIMGYGGIPITYTMEMRDGLPALIPEGQSYSVWSILKSAVG